MYEFENDLDQELSDFGKDDVANDIAQFEAKSKQKPSTKTTSTKTKPLIHQTSSKEDEVEANKTEIKNQILCDNLYKKLAYSFTH